MQFPRIRHFGADCPPRVKSAVSTLWQTLPVFPDQRTSSDRQAGPVRPSRPGEFHPEPLTDPDLTLSRHPARATARRLPPSVENWSSSCCQLARSQRRLTCPLRSTSITPASSLLQGRPNKLALLGTRSNCNWSARATGIFRTAGGPTTTLESDDALADGEIKCEACNGTGVQLAKQPSEPGKRIYPHAAKFATARGDLRRQPIEAH